MYKRTTKNGIEYSDGEYWFDEPNVCRHCMDQREADGQPFRWAELRTSFGIYAGRYCDECWPKSGFRDADDPTVSFDPMDAGEALEPEDY